MTHPQNFNQAFIYLSIWPTPPEPVPKKYIDNQSLFQKKTIIDFFDVMTNVCGCLF